jgi:hypothetical protein
MAKTGGRIRVETNYDIESVWIYKHNRILSCVPICVRSILHNGLQAKRVRTHIPPQTRIVVPVPVVGEAVLELEPLAGEALVRGGGVFGDVVHFAEGAEDHVPDERPFSVSHAPGASVHGLNSATPKPAKSMVLRVASVRALPAAAAAIMASSGSSARPSEMARARSRPARRA